MEDLFPKEPYMGFGRLFLRRGWAWSSRSFGPFGKKLPLAMLFYAQARSVLSLKLGGRFRCGNRCGG